VLIGVQGAFWAIVLPYMLAWIWDLRPRGANAGGAFLARVALPAVAVAVTIAVLLKLAELNTSTWWPPAALNGVPIGNLKYFTIVGIAVAAIAICGMFVVNWRMAADAGRRKDGVLDVERYLALCRFLDSFLLLAALILGLGVLATAFLREAYNASQTAHALPKWSVIAFGALYSVFLALYYGACRLQFLAQGNRLLDALTGPPPKTRSAVLNWADARASLSDVLRLRLHGLSAFGESFSVAIPFVTGIITSLLGTSTSLPGPGG
jgi:hypothetical protein